MRFWVITMLCCLSITSAARSQSLYDGIWNVIVRTTAGSCEPTARYAVTVADEFRPSECLRRRRPLR